MPKDGKNAHSTKKQKNLKPTFENINVIGVGLSAGRHISEKTDGFGGAIAKRLNEAREAGGAKFRHEIFDVRAGQAVESAKSQRCVLDKNAAYAAKLLISVETFIDDDVARVAL